MTGARSVQVATLASLLGQSQSVAGAALGPGLTAAVAAAIVAAVVVAVVVAVAVAADHSDRTACGSHGSLWRHVVCSNLRIQDVWRINKFSWRLLAPTIFRGSS